MCRVAGCEELAAPGGRYPDGLCVKHAEAWCDAYPLGTPADLARYPVRTPPAPKARHAIYCRATKASAHVAHADIYCPECDVLRERGSAWLDHFCWDTTLPSNPLPEDAPPVRQGMALYEVRTGFEGESYERCYAWAPSAEAAEKDARVQNAARFERAPKLRLTVTLLFRADAPPFATYLSDAGWVHAR